MSRYAVLISRFLGHPKFLLACRREGVFEDTLRKVIATYGHRVIKAQTAENTFSYVFDETYVLPEFEIVISPKMDIRRFTKVSEFKYREKIGL